MKDESSELCRQGLTPSRGVVVLTAGYSRPGISSQSSKLTTSLRVDSKPTGLCWQSKFLSINEQFWSSHLCWQRFFMRLMTHDLSINVQAFVENIFGFTSQVFGHNVDWLKSQTQAILIMIERGVTLLEDEWWRNHKHETFVLYKVERESVDLNGWTQAKTLTTECDSYLTCTVLWSVMHRVLYTVHRHYYVKP